MGANSTIKGGYGKGNSRQCLQAGSAGHTRLQNHVAYCLLHLVDMTHAERVAEWKKRRDEQIEALTVRGSSAPAREQFAAWAKSPARISCGRDGFYDKGIDCIVILR